MTTVLIEPCVRDAGYCLTGCWRGLFKISNIDFYFRIRDVFGGTIRLARTDDHLKLRQRRTGNVVVANRTNCCCRNAASKRARASPRQSGPRTLEQRESHMHPALPGHKRGSRHLWAKMICWQLQRCTHRLAHSEGPG